MVGWSSTPIRMIVLAMVITSTFAVDSMSTGNRDVNDVVDENADDSVHVFADLINMDGFCTNKDECGDDIHLAKLLLHPSEFGDAIEVVHNSESLANFLSNLFAILDVGTDLAGEPTGLAGNGDLDRDEIANRIYATTRGWQSIADDEWLAIVDKDFDGLVTKEELENSIEHTANLKQKELLHTGALNRFAIADKNKDRYLSDTDVIAFRNPIWEKRMHTAAAYIFLNEVDANDNGVLSKNEYMTASGPLWNETTRNMPQKSLEEEFKRLDRDDSGEIDVYELTLMPEARTMSILASGVDFLMSKADTDKSNTIDVQELENLAKLLHDDLLQEQPPSRDETEL
eukprot:m.134514 g.134514  ORF g.134514 m.134514 type:complete len:343 (-) comp29743_c1_seq2:128-1156(-)